MRGVTNAPQRMDQAISSTMAGTTKRARFADMKRHQRRMQTSVAAPATLTRLHIDKDAHARGFVPIKF